MRNDILNRLYRSEIRPDEDDKPMMEELTTARWDFARRCDKLLAEMNAPLRDRIQALMEEREEVAALEKEDADVRSTRIIGEYNSQWRIVGTGGESYFINTDNLR